MHPTVDLVWNAPAHAWDMLAGRLGDLGFEYRVARVRRLRRAGRDLEAERTLLAMQGHILARCRRRMAGG